MNKAATREVGTSALTLRLVSPTNSPRQDSVHPPPPFQHRLANVVLQPTPCCPRQPRTHPPHRRNSKRHQGKPHKPRITQVWVIDFCLLTHLPDRSGQVSVALEELKAIGAVSDYSVVATDFSKNDQKSPWFEAVNPNGRIPALLHNREDKGPLNVFEVSRAATCPTSPWAKH